MGPSGQRLALFVCSLLVLAGCGPVRRSTRVSSLERYDSLAGPLRSITMLSRLVAIDARQLRHLMQRGALAQVRRTAIELKLHALQLSHSSGATGNQVGVLLRGTRSEIVHAYLTAIFHALTAQWWEGTDLVRLADAVWADPWGTTGDAVTMTEASRRAQRSARYAATQTAYAVYLEHRYPKQFEYHESTAEQYAGSAAG